MSKKLVTAYTFNKTTKTIVSADFTSLEKIQLITNVTSNIIIYNFADPTKGGALVGTTLTLTYDTTAMNSADKLQIFLDDGSSVAITALGQMQVTSDPISTMKDTFDGGTIDVTNQWATTGTVVPTQASGTILINPAATASATSALNSQPTFPGGVNDGYVFQMKIEATTIALGNYRFWGKGTSPSGVGTSAAPIQDGIGFEVTTTGQLRAVVYSAGAVVFSQNMTTPTDGNSHLYLLQINSGISFFYYDQTIIASASTPLAPAVQNLPIRVVSLNSASVTGTPTLAMTGFGVVDYTRSTNQISDGTYSWRKAEVTALGALSVYDKDTIATATIAANAISGASIALNGDSTYSFDLSGTFVATLQVQVSIDGVNWRNITGSNAVQNIATSAYVASGNITAAGAYCIDAGGAGFVRLITTAFTSGSIVIAARASSGNAMMGIEGIPAVTGSGNFAVTMAASATASPAKARDAASAGTDVGDAVLYIRRDTPTALTPAAGDYEVPQIDGHGSTWVREKTSTTSALTNVAASITNVTVLAANTGRKGATIYNDSTSVCYLKFGATATATSFTVKLAADDYYEVPAQYVGIIDGIWVAANGAARVTEITS